MSEKRIADSILMGKILDRSIEEAERELEALPYNHPASLNHYLDRTIVEEASAFGVNEDVAQTIGLLREIEAEQVRPGRAEANQAVMDDYDAGLRRFIATSGAF